MSERELDLSGSEAASRDDVAHPAARDPRHGGTHERAGATLLHRMTHAPLHSDGAAHATKLLPHDGGVLIHTQRANVYDVFGKLVGSEHLQEGTYVEPADPALKPGVEKELATSPGHQAFFVYSGASGAAPYIAVLPLSGIDRQPRLQRDTGGGPTATTRFGEFMQPLWVGQPKLADIDQGALGDCYLMSSMAALVAQSPQGIERLFEHPTMGAPTYRVGFFERNHDGTFRRRWVTVDRMLPTEKQQSGKAAASYASLGMPETSGGGQAPTAMWPALLEKAYAQLLDGYDAIGDGGFASHPLETLTGEASTRRDLESGGDAPAILAQLRRHIAKGDVMVADSRPPAPTTHRHGFSQEGDGVYTAQLRDSNGHPTEVSAATVNISDDSHGHALAYDDGKGHFSSVLTGELAAQAQNAVSGTIDYASGAIELHLGPTRRPLSAGALTITASVGEVVDVEHDVIGLHAYMLESVSDDGLITLHNPWGNRQPKPMWAKDFLRIYGELYANPGHHAKRNT